ncbi:glycosyltransferase family protein [Candidatus Manganitrophus noduliformans]|uniref:Glycosyltransferase n=1 Tax=Candidatus Manganitrophus noduliformans TaxID=2606439 RepID=A0A7X6DPE0_9BACT|nr:glycosyltransferase [Candidatus Manganitrophus noduliformans]NKE70862.1 glycosyltransferase [Candidatus Manganitrophus noduliformans]
MKKLMVYSHDTFGLGNIRRMLSICKYLIDSIPDLSILIVSGSPMVHTFRIPQRLDYIKLPCLRRTEREGYSVKYLGTDMAETMRLRSELILSAVTHFRPDLLLVDKKPFGVKKELKGVLNYLKIHLPETKQVLLLRDILDSPEATIKVWKQNRYQEAIRLFYDLVLVVGSSEVFDPRKEYRMPPSVSGKVQLCGYIRREAGLAGRDAVRKELQLTDERLVLVTPGGGEDGYRLVKAYLSALERLPTGLNIRSLIICGPEMPEIQRKQLFQAAAGGPSVQMTEFTNDLMSYMEAADVVLSMAGYNTVCEILSLQKRAIVVPRVHPVKEQLLRAERMARLGLLRTIHPDRLTPQSLAQGLLEELDLQGTGPVPRFPLEMNALPQIRERIMRLLSEAESDESADRPVYRRDRRGPAQAGDHVQPISIL